MRGLLWVRRSALECEGATPLYYLRFDSTDCMSTHVMCAQLSCACVRMLKHACTAVHCPSVPRIIYPTWKKGEVCCVCLVLIVLLIDRGQVAFLR